MIAPFQTWSISCSFLCMLALANMQLSAGAIQNLSVSFDSLSANSGAYWQDGSITGDGTNVVSNLPEHGGIKAYLVYQADAIDYDPQAWLVFIPASINASSYILAVLVYSEFGDPAAVKPSPQIVVWMANRNNPVSGNFSLSLNQSSGNLELLDGDGSLAWSSNSSTMRTGVVSMDLIADNSVPHPQATGTLLLFDANNETLWQSSDHPTHTLVNAQFLKPGMSLISWASTSDSSQGLYSLVMEAGGLVLYYNAFDSRQPYWIWSYYGRNDSFGVTHTCSNLTRAYMDPGAGLRLEKDDEIAALNLKWPDLCSSAHHSLDKLESEGHEMIFPSSSSQDPSITLLWLQYDGNLRVYTLGSSLIVDLDLFGDNRCLLPNYCGPYGVCRAPGNCECPRHGSFPSRFPSNHSQGCPPKHSLSTCLLHNQTLTNTHVDSSQSQQQQLVALTGVDYFPNKYSSPLNFSTQETCTDVCLQNCSCLAAFWHVHSSSCFHVDDHMSSLQGSSNDSYLAFLKVEALVPQSTSSSQSKSSSAPRLIAGVVSGAVALLVALCILATFIYRKLMRPDLESEEEETFWESVPRMPTRYSYKELHSITNGFSEQLGRGGFGAVYAGVLRDGTRVAVKRLESLRQGKKEFRAEVVILGGIHHYNLVGLIGFCAQGPHRLLVYEYMTKGSLDQWLFTSTESPPLMHWKYRFNIALGAARGLAYLHGECKGTIIHLDIKPQNILLDEDFVAKISDFGLSTLMGRDETHKKTTMRGTPGYLAPEWLTEESALSEKCDVFSFGKLLMEILGGRRNLDPSLADTEKVYFPSWLYHQVTQEGREAEITHIARVETPEEMRQARFMMNTAFLCVLEDPDLRPSMERVVHMLEGRAPELEHLHLSDLFQGLQFALRIHSPSLAEKTFAADHQSSSDSMPGTSQGGVMSFHISTR